MAMAQQKSQNPLYMSEADYLAFEEQSEIKHEYARGRVYEMAGADWNHVMITQSTSSALYAQLRGKSCKVGTNDLRLKVKSKKVSYRYPDVMVTCDKPNFIENRKTIDNPTLIIEVLSPTTALEDHNAKLEATLVGHHGTSKIMSSGKSVSKRESHRIKKEYTQLDSVQEYLLIAQNEAKVEHYFRENSGRWVYTLISGLDKSLELPSIACTLALSEIYEQVEVQNDDRS